MQQVASTTLGRNRRQARLGLLGGIVLAMLAFGQAPAQAALLDANCPGPPNTNYNPLANVRAAETFKALHTGTVVRAQLEINKLASGGNFTMQILDTDPASGAPVNGILGSGTTPDSSVPDGDTTLSVTFNSPAPVTAGHLYALVTTRPDEFQITDRSGNPCPDGMEWNSPGPTEPFSSDPNYDQVFSVFVNPPNQFTIGKQKGNKLSLNLPGPGTLTVGDAKKKKSLKSSTIAVAGAGAVTVKLKLTKGAKQLLRQKGKLSVKGAITFTPTGGDPNTQKKKLKFKQ
jgi:hypothetical protein